MHNRRSDFVLILRTSDSHAEIFYSTVDLKNEHIGENDTVDLVIIFPDFYSALSSKLKSGNEIYFFQSLKYC